MAIDYAAGLFTAWWTRKSGVWTRHRLDFDTLSPTVMFLF